MVDFILLDLDIHKPIFIELNREFFKWNFSEFIESAISLYHSLGFFVREEYTETEIPQEFRKILCVYG